MSHLGEMRLPGEGWERPRRDRPTGQVVHPVLLQESLGGVDRVGEEPPSRQRLRVVRSYAKARPVDTPKGKSAPADARTLPMQRTRRLLIVSWIYDANSRAAG
jgi:hypothetical protein